MIHTCRMYRAEDGEAYFLGIPVRVQLADEAACEACRHTCPVCGETGVIFSPLDYDGPQRWCFEHCPDAPTYTQPPLMEAGL